MSEPPSPSPAARQRRKVVLLGATGSIGRNALRVVAAHADKLELAAVAARSNWRQLAEIAREFAVRDVAIYDAAAFREAQALGRLSARHPPPSGGPPGWPTSRPSPRRTSSSSRSSGTAGLEPALAALAAGKDLALASKEILVLAGPLRHGGGPEHRAPRILPVDSEHNAVFQCLEGHPGSRAAGGSPDGQRRARSGTGRAERLAHATPADALKHPNWAMGPKITVDSATLANKGLELIEAQWLFDLRPEQCTAVLHPQSIVHCLVEFNDGAMLAQLAPSSMTFPIQHALLYPERARGVEPPLDFTRLVSLEFRPVDAGPFPMMRLATEAMEAGGVAPAVFNAANEVAVEAFLAERIPFLAIPAIVGKALARTAQLRTRQTSPMS